MSITSIETSQEEKTMTNRFYGIQYLLMSLVVFPYVQPIYAQTSSTNMISSPSTIICEKIENFGAITEQSIAHPHNIILNFAQLSDGEYSYSGVAQNSKDDGGGESASVFYDATTGKFISGTDGIICPTILPVQ